MHAFWFTLILPGATGAVIYIERLRNPMVWLLASIASFTYLGIFSFPFVQGMLAGGPVRDDMFARVIYQLIVTSNLPLVQVTVACLVNLGLILVGLKQHQILPGSKPSESIERNMPNHD